MWDVPGQVAYLLYYISQSYCLSYAALSVSVLGRGLKFAPYIIKLLLNVIGSYKKTCGWTSQRISWRSILCMYVSNRSNQEERISVRFENVPWLLAAKLLEEETNLVNLHAKRRKYARHVSLYNILCSQNKTWKIIKQSWS